MRRIITTLSRFVLSAVMLLSLSSLTTSQAAVVSNAEETVPANTVPAAAPKSSVTRITDTYVIKKDTTIEAGETLYVKNGGQLFIMEGAVLTVKGKLKSADGGEIYVRGKVNAESGSASFISGKMKLMESGSFSLGGKLTVNPTGLIKGKGVLCVLNNFSDISCSGTVSAKIQAPAPVETDGVTTVGGVLLVNKQYSLPKDYGNGLDQKTYSAFLKMKKDSGFDMSIISGFRSYEKQQEVFDGWVAIDGYDKAVTYSAIPGQSEHQSGLAIDITSLNQSYGSTAEGKWLAQNCWKYGFIIRYPKGSSKITGYMYEPWHVRYLGKSTAKLVHDSGLTLEEFFGLA